MTTRVYPDEAVDLSLMKAWGCWAGVDEVGRGALAGPVAVGVVASSRNCGRPPAGIADSKVLSPASRRALVRPIRSWAAACAVGWASPDEIGTFGLTTALRLAALRALSLVENSLRLQRQEALSGILLDGRHDYLSPKESSLFGLPDLTGVQDPWADREESLPVATLVRADLKSHAVAAASILAKVARDDYMGAISDPGYGWDSNRGYGSRSHLTALKSLGPSRRHRTTWNLPL